MWLWFGLVGTSKVYPHLDKNTSSVSLRIIWAVLGENY